MSVPGRVGVLAGLEVLALGDLGGVLRGTKCRMSALSRIKMVSMGIKDLVLTFVTLPTIVSTVPLTFSPIVGLCVSAMPCEALGWVSIRAPPATDE